MTPEDHQLLSEMMAEFLRFDAEDQDDYLSRLRSRNAELACELESLLLQQGNVPEILETGALSRAIESILAPETRIGPYRIVRCIGEGGMGVVYHAEQDQPIRKDVAIKLIKPGLETKEVLARFDAERLALERMVHPNIAGILDAGVTPDGHPFVAMEYVRGEPITEYCETHGLSLRDRLQLFLRVCAAVTFAHQNAIIHRDIKPSNVLVTCIDGHGVPKVIDFGIAKALTRRVDASVTQVGQLIGTPTYMSPEQLADPTTIDIRTDVYSLGVLLYELFVGHPPVDKERLKGLSLEAIRELLANNEPLAPSAVTQIDKDLDCIVMKALRHRCSERYASVPELAADIGRHLRDEPVQARPATRAYRARKLVARNRTAATLAAVIAPLLLTGALAFGFQASRVANERDSAEEIAQFLVEFYEWPFFVSGRHGDRDAISMLKRQAVAVETKLADRPLLQARMTHSIGEALRVVGQVDHARELLSGAHAALTELAGAEDPRTLTAMVDLARAYRDQERFDESEELFARALEAQRRILGGEHLDSLRTMTDLAFVFKQVGRNEEASNFYQRALPGIRRELGADHAETQIVTSLFASVLLELRQLDEAEKMLRDILPTIDDKERGMALYNLGCIYALRGDKHQALDFLRQSADATFVIDYYADRKLAPLFEDADFVAFAKRAFVQHQKELFKLSARAFVYAETDRGDEAEAINRYLMDALRTTNAQEYRVAGNRLADLYLKQGRFAEAQTIIDERLSYARSLGDRGGEFKLSNLKLQTQLAFGDLGAALATAEEMPRLGRRTTVTYALALRAAVAGDRTEALSLLEEAIENGFGRNAMPLRDNLALRSLHGMPEFERLSAVVADRYEYF